MTFEKGLAGTESHALVFEPLRVGVQGEAIRDLDIRNLNSNPQTRKAGFGDSDDEDQQAQARANDRSTMDIYRRRQQKRVKLTQSNALDQATPPVLT